MNDSTQKIATALRGLVEAIYNDAHCGDSQYIPYDGDYEDEIQAVAKEIVFSAGIADHKKDAEKAILNNYDLMIPFGIVRVKDGG